MENDEMIRIDLICTGYNIEPAFIDSLLDSGLIDIVIVEENKFLPARTIHVFEKIMRLHYDLDINLPGIETILHLTERINMLQDELNALKNKVQFYEIEGMRE